MRSSRSCLDQRRAESAGSTPGTDAAARNAAKREGGRPFASRCVGTIGADAWVAAAAIIRPGVTIGDRAVIGAGRVVTRDIAGASGREPSNHAPS
jgi:acetyltransferase-like isoleucine patch superfamily enzyme